MPSDANSPLTNAALARLWRCSAPYISKLRRPAAEGGKGMPAFGSIAEADAWRAVNAPPKSVAGLPHSLNRSSEAEKKIADSNPSTTVACKKAAAPAPGGGGESGKSSPANTADAAADVIDVRAFITPGADFETLMISQAEEVPQVARGLFMLACSKGNPSEISAANRNWHESAKSAYAVRADFIELQERTGALVSVDDVRDILGTELQAARAAFLKLGERIAARANPADPLAAKAAIDAGVDDVFRLLDAALSRGVRELAQERAS